MGAAHGFARDNTTTRRTGNYRWPSLISLGAGTAVAIPYRRGIARPRPSRPPAHSAAPTTTICYIDLEQKTLQPLDNPFGPRTRKCSSRRVRCQRSMSHWIAIAERRAFVPAEETHFGDEHCPIGTTPSRPAGPTRSAPSRRPEEGRPCVDVPLALVEHARGRHRVPVQAVGCAAGDVAYNLPSRSWIRPARRWRCTAMPIWHPGLVFNRPGHGGERECKSLLDQALVLCVSAGGVAIHHIDIRVRRRRPWEAVQSILYRVSDKPGPDPTVRETQRLHGPEYLNHRGLAGDERGNIGGRGDQDCEPWRWLVARIKLRTS
jgi:hypothetical protein